MLSDYEMCRKVKIFIKNLNFSLKMEIFKYDNMLRDLF